MVKSWLYLGSDEVPKEEGQCQEQYPHSVACHVLACVLVDVHVYEVRCIGCGYLDHACQGVEGAESISEARPDAPEHSICYQLAVWGLYSSCARKTCVYVYKDEGRTYSPYRPIRN